MSDDNREPWREPARKALLDWMEHTKSSLVLQAFAAGTEKDRTRTADELVARLDRVFWKVYKAGFLAAQGVDEEIEFDVPPEIDPDFLEKLAAAVRDGTLDRYLTWKEAEELARIAS